MLIMNFKKKKTEKLGKFSNRKEFRDPEKKRSNQNRAVHAMEASIHYVITVGLYVLL